MSILIFYRIIPKEIAFCRSKHCNCIPAKCIFIDYSLDLFMKASGNPDKMEMIIK